MIPLERKRSTEEGKPRDCHLSKGGNIFKNKGITKIPKVTKSFVNTSVEKR